MAVIAPIGVIIWLGVLGEWWFLLECVLSGIIAAVLVGFVFRLALAGSYFAFAKVSTAFGGEEKTMRNSESTVAMLYFATCCAAVIAVLCSKVLFSFVELGAENNLLLPALILSYNAAIMPFMFAIYGEADSSAAFVASIAYILAGVAVIFFSFTFFEVMALIFATMLAGLILYRILSTINIPPPAK